MSARAAVRLQRLGFSHVFDYVAGKNDWAAAGFEREGKSAVLPTSGDLAREVPTCNLDDPIEEARKRLENDGDRRCVVVDSDGTVLGVVHAKDLESTGGTAEDVMKPGPVTIRANETLDTLGALADRMENAGVASLLVTDADGRLIGALDRSVARRAAETLHEMQHDHDHSR